MAEGVTHVHSAIPLLQLRPVSFPALWVGFEEPKICGCHDVLLKHVQPSNRCSLQWAQKKCPNFPFSELKRVFPTMSPHEAKPEPHLECSPKWQIKDLRSPHGCRVVPKPRLPRSHRLGTKNPFARTPVHKIRHSALCNSGRHCKRPRKPRLQVRVRCDSWLSHSRRNAQSQWFKRISFPTPEHPSFCDPGHSWVHTSHLNPPSPARPFGFFASLLHSATPPKQRWRSPSHSAPHSCCQT